MYLKTFLHCKACRDQGQFQELFTTTLFPETVLLPVVVRPFFTASEQSQGCPGGNVEQEGDGRQKKQSQKSRTFIVQEFIIKAFFLPLHPAAGLCSPTSLITSNSASDHLYLITLTVNSSASDLKMLWGEDAFFSF